MKKNNPKLEKSVSTKQETKKEYIPLNLPGSEYIIEEARTFKQRYNA